MYPGGPPRPLPLPPGVHPGMPFALPPMPMVRPGMGAPPMGYMPPHPGHPPQFGESPTRRRKKWGVLCAHYASGALHFQWRWSSELCMRCMCRVFSHGCLCISVGGAGLVSSRGWRVWVVSQIPTHSTTTIVFT